MASESKKTIRSSGGDYTSLSAWESGEQGDLPSLDVWKVAEIDQSWVSADTTAVTIDGWTTDATRYIRVYTTAAARHDGKWNSNRYRLETSTTGNTLLVEESYVKISGLQFYRSNITADNVYVMLLNSNVGSDISHCLIRGNGNGSWYDGGIRATGGNGPFRVWNCVVYDVGGGTAPSAISVNCTDSSGTWSVYNTTIVAETGGAYVGIKREDGTATAINNIIKGATTPCSGVFASASGYNATDAASMGYTGAGGTGDRVSQTFTFAGSSDFHLAASDAGAKDYGTDLSAYFTDDIDGETRTGSWDIGADEVLIVPASALLGLAFQSTLRHLILR